MKNYLIMHGHFYQPPREDPWTGIVHTQPSAAPFHDWNARITRECYAANAASRFLHYDGRIEDIINNYRILSFNFGPTLLWWIKNEAPHVYEAILEADRLSVDANNGHGNAIAQAYNHTILPLDETRDARIQIKWGLADFEYHFGRPSEGIWLPETAINEEIADILLEEGIKFVILSPWQAEAIFADGAEEWEELGDKPAPYQYPYRLERPHGNLNVFLYNQDLAQGLSFEHYLKSADTLYTRLLASHDSENPGHLIHVATDGEVYGHHEPYGDMCLAALQKHVREGNKFTFTNYGNYLALYPPVHQVRLRPGEKGLGSSWSCHHGVSRWYKDCGCSTGGKKGWNQQWRTPLREGLRHLSTRLWSVFTGNCAELSETPPEELLLDYIRVLTRRTEPEDFAAEHLKGKKTTDHNISSLLSLLEGQKYRLYSFTSCGWFFADIDGIEPIQNIRYALKAVELYREYSDTPFLEDFMKELSVARSNDPEIGTGGDIIKRERQLLLPEGIEAASYYFMILLMSGRENCDHRYGYFNPVKISVKKKSDNSMQTEIELTDKTRVRKFRFSLTTLTDAFSIRVEDLLNPETGTITVDPEKLPLELREKINYYLVRSIEESLAEHAAQTFEDTSFAISQADLLGIQPPSVITKTAAISVTTLLYRALEWKKTSLDETEISRIVELLKFAARYSIPIDHKRISQRLTRFLWLFFDRLTDHPCSRECDYIGRLITALREAGVEPDITIPQKAIFSHISKWRSLLYPTNSDTRNLRKVSPNRMHDLSQGEKDELAILIKLCDVMGIYADDIKEPFSRSSR